MTMRNFWFSYQNILKRQILKKKYFNFFRKIFGTLYKFIIKFFRYQFSLNYVNLDKFNRDPYLKYSLDELFINFNCDKGSYFLHNENKIISHNYSPFYEKYFYKFREKKINLLELGSHEGKGLASFYFYFPNSNLIGANINPFQLKFKSKRITELFVDVSSKKILGSLNKYINEELDIIIDDASHNLKDIIIAFIILFKKLKSGGIYVIEDINQFDVFKNLNPYKNEITPLEIFRRIQNKQDFDSTFIDKESKKYLLENVAEIKIEKGSMLINQKNISDIVFIFKK